MLNLAVPTPLSALIARLPVQPPSLVFTLAANRLLWPALKTLDWHALVGRRYAIHVKDIGLRLRFTVTERGFAPDSGAPELTISATAADLLRLLRRQEDPDTLFFSRRLVSEGDTELGLIIKNLLDALDPETAFRDIPPPVAHVIRSWLRVPCG